MRNQRHPQIHIVRTLNNRKAQAVTELAVLGSLIIIAFSFLINYSEKLNRQQSYMQQTFRIALREARSAGDAKYAVTNPGSTASYSKVAFLRMPNVSSPMDLGQLQSFSSSNKVMWGSNAENISKNGVAKYQLNEDAPITLPPDRDWNKDGILDESDRALEGDWNVDGKVDEEDLEGDWNADGKVDEFDRPENETTTDTFTNTTEPVTTTFIKTQSPAGAIITTRKLDATDKLEASVFIGGKKYNFTHYLGAQGKYYPDEQSLTRSRTWTTNE